MFTLTLRGDAKKMWPWSFLLANLHVTERAAQKENKGINLRHWPLHEFARLSNEGLPSLSLLDL